MSDTQGANLEGDMPPIGTAPPQTGVARSPMQLPSALGGLARMFQTQQPQPQRQQRPSLPSTDPPDPTARSVGPSPGNARQAPATFSPFIKNLPRDSSDWGKADAYARLPQSYELPGMFNQLGQYFSQHGTYESGPVANGLMFFSQAYSEAFTKAQETKMRTMREQMELHRNRLADLEDGRATGYADIFNRHKVMGDADPHSVSLHDEIWRKAVEIGDTDVIKMMEQGGSVEEVRRFLADHEARLRDLKAANSKADQQAAEDAKAWGLPVDQTPSTDPWDQPIGGETQAAPAGPSAEGQVAGPGAPPGPGGPPPAQDGTSPIPADPPELQPYQQAGLNIARGNTPTGLPKNVADAAEKFAGQVEKRLDNVVGHSAGKSREQIAQELSAISPAIASDWSKLLDAKVGLPGGMSQVGAKPYWSDLSDLAIAVKPSWSAQDFVQLGEMNRDYTAGITGRRMQRLESMAAAARTLLQAYQQIPEGEKPPIGALEAAINSKFTGQSNWGRVFAAYHTYVQEAQTIASQSGNFHETDVIRVMRETPYTAGPEFARGSTLLVDAQNAVDTMNDYNEDYKRLAGKDAPHWNQSAINTLRTVASYDPKTHRFREILDPRLQGMDRSFNAQDDPTPSGGGGPPAPPNSGLPPGFRWK